MPPGAAALAGAGTAYGALLVLAVTLPCLGLLGGFALGGRAAERLALALLPAGLFVAAAILGALYATAAPVVYVLGGWAPPLGIALRADGFSAAMLLTTAIVVGAVALYARDGFATAPAQTEARAPLAFWTLLLALWTGLNVVFVAGDLFTLFVALELLTFAAVPLVCLDGSATTLAAALRYLLFALLGSVLYLLGAALLYGGYGTLDIALLGGQLRATPATRIALALMTVGMLAKTAVVPLHLWLPPAHAGAPPAASALLSALVVKGSFFILVRLWFDVASGLAGAAVMQLLGGLGASAILLGSVLALRQARVKLLVAYSTVAQVGYLMLIFPLALGDGAAGAWAATAWSGGTMQALAHAFAKSAMFLAAGLFAEALGHDRIAALGGAARAMPMAMLGFGIAGLSLMGVPPNSGFVAKWWLLTAATESGQWWWAMVNVVGGLLAGGYVFRVIAAAMAEAPAATPPPDPVGQARQAVVLGLALVSLLLGVLPLFTKGLLLVGRAALTGAP